MKKIKKIASVSLLALLLAPASVNASCCSQETLEDIRDGAEKAYGGFKKLVSVTQSTLSVLQAAGVETDEMNTAFGVLDKVNTATDTVDSFAVMHQNGQLGTDDLLAAVRKAKGKLGKEDPHRHMLKSVSTAIQEHEKHKKDKLRNFKARTNEPQE